jgi:hypothetical protein
VGNSNAALFSAPHRFSSGAVERVGMLLLGTPARKFCERGRKFIFPNSNGTVHDEKPTGEG